MKLTYLLFIFSILFNIGDSLEYKHRHHLHKRASKCTNSDEVSKNVFFGYRDGPKTDANKNLANKVFNTLKGYVNSYSKESFYNSQGNVAGFMWVGSMVQNKGFIDNILPIVYDEVNKFGIPSRLYIEYVDGDPMKGFGVILDTTNNADEVKKAAKLWSQGKSYNSYGGSKNYNGKSVCYLSYSNRKPIVNENGIGQCNFVKVESGKSVVDQTGVNGESLQGYNPGVDFTKLVPGQPICYSIGTAPAWEKPKTCTDATAITKNVFFGYKVGPKTDSNKALANKIFDIFKNFMKSDGKESFYNSQGNVAGFMWVGSMIQNKGFAENILPIIIDEVNKFGIPDKLYIEYVDGDPMKGFGIILDTTNNPNEVKKAGKLWSQGKSYNSYGGSKNYNNQNVCYLDYAKRKAIVNDNGVGECNYVKVESGKNIVDQTGVNAESLKGYNPNLDFSKLQAGQPVCYSIGNLPNLKPKKNSDGSCYSYQVKSGDTCASITASYYPLSINDLNNYNSKTYGWYGCNKLMKDQKICLSDGNPPKPTPDPKAECGPLAPGDLYNKECPLNACCSEFGFCGLTKDFCEKKNSDTNAPGTTGCFSNCGYGSVPSGQSGSFQRITYWLDAEGKMAMDPKNLLGGNYDKVHYAFVDIKSDLSIDDSKISKSSFLSISQKKIASFGGWDFSTSSSTYQIFRNGVKSDNRDKFAKNLVDFVNKYNLDGIDLDWEYPAEPDIPGIPSDDKNNGKNYLELIKNIKSKLPSGKTLSVALPASYWYLKGFPVKDMQNYVDYFVYMTYDMHGSWDYGKKDTSIDCHTNKKDVVDSIKMLNKAGVNFNKVYGGLANYGRSYKLKDNNCYSIGCPFAGPGNSRDMTNTKGVLSDSEIIDIDRSSSKNTRWNDGDSQCIFMKYDGDSVVSWTTNRNDMENYFKNSGFAGSVLWANNYFKHDQWEDDGYEDDEDELKDDVDEYVDIYDCKNKAGYDLNNYVYGCKYETAIKFIIKNGTNAVNIVNNILDDYDNYIKYYEALTTAHYDNVMQKYEKWFIEDKAYDKYFTEMNPKDIVITPLKKRYNKDVNITLELNFMENNNLTEVIKVTKPEKYLIQKFDNGTTNVEPIKITYLNKREIDKKCTTNNPARCPSYTYTYSNFVIKDENKDNAISDFEQKYNIKLTKDMFVQREKSKKFQIDGDTDTYVFLHTTILDAHKLYPNVLTNINKEYVQNINSLIEYADKNIGNEDPMYIYEVVESVLIFAQTAETAKMTYDEGKHISDEKKKMKKLLIINIILSIIGGLSLFFGPIGITVSVLTDLALLGADAGINGELDPETLSFALVGLFLPVFGEISKLSKFDVIFDLIKANKTKNFDNLNNFENIKNMRKFLGKIKSCST